MLKSRSVNRKKMNPNKIDKKTLNKWQGMINEQNSLGAQCDHFIKETKQTLLQER